MTHNPNQKFETKLVRCKELNFFSLSLFFFFFFNRLGLKDGDKLVKERNIPLSNRVNKIAGVKQ